MSLRSSLSAVLMAGVVGLGFLAPCGAPKAVADPNSGDRLGCGAACQSDELARNFLTVTRWRTIGEE